MNILNNSKSLLFCFHTFCVRRSIDGLDPENRPGSGSGSAFFPKCQNAEPGLQGLQRTSDTIITICPRSGDSLYILTYYIKQVTTSGTVSSNEYVFDQYKALGQTVLKQRQRQKRKSERERRIWRETERKGTKHCQRFSAQNRNF